MRVKYNIGIFLLSLGLIACNDTWDEHYSSEESQIINNQEVEVVNKPVGEYLSTSRYKGMYELFSQANMLDRINSSEQLMTVLVVSDENLANTSMAEEDMADNNLVYRAGSYLSDASLSPSSFADGQRVLMWNGKYLNVTKQLSLDGAGEDILFNHVKVQRIIKTQNAYVYELEDEVIAPKSMYETISELGDDYSLFRDMILSRCQRVFDQEASLPIGVDATGNTVYDSVWVVRNPYFESYDFDLMSENNNVTMMIPSNEIINKAKADAKAKLEAWHMQREDSILDNWFFQVAFFDGKLNSAALQNTDPDAMDLISIFDRQWRTTVQKVNVQDSIPLSNGIAYYITDLRIPTNMLIYRLKDYFKYYDNISSTDKDRFFVAQNLTFDKVEEKVAPWSGWPGVFPKISNVVLRYTLTDKELDEAEQSHAFQLDFTPFKYASSADGYTVEEYLVPPGTYDLCLGFEQKTKGNIKIYVNDEYVGTATESQMTKTDFHYDRGGQGYPEGYDTSKATDKKKGNYDRDGAKIGVVTITGTEAKPVKITFKGEKVSNNKTCFHHWCLKPTVDCY